MKMAFYLTCLLFCSCSRTEPARGQGGGDDSAWLSTDATRRVGMHVLLNRYPHAEIVSERAEGQNWRYRFSTNGTVVPSEIVVDRKAAKAHFESLNR